MGRTFAGSWIATTVPGIRRQGFSGRRELAIGRMSLRGSAPRSTKASACPVDRKTPGDIVAGGPFASAATGIRRLWPEVALHPEHHRPDILIAEADGAKFSRQDASAGAGGDGTRIRGIKPREEH